MAFNWHISTDEAFDIVLNLARQNMADEHEMPDEYACQQRAIEIVEAFLDDITKGGRS